MEIHNLYSLDIFFQGSFLLICVFIGLYIVFTDNLETFNEIYTLEKFTINLHHIAFNIINMLSFNKGVNLSKINFRFIGMVPVIIITSFILGIMGYGIADQWIDSNGNSHLGLKPLWGSELIEFYDKSHAKVKKEHIKEIKNLKHKDLIQHKTFGKAYNSISNKENTNSIEFRNKFVKKLKKVFINERESLKYKDLLRYKTFEKVYNRGSNKENTDKIAQLYFHAKHEIMEKDAFTSYVRKSQAMSEYARIFALGFFFLLLSGFLNILLMIIRVSFDKPDEKEKADNIKNKVLIGTDYFKEKKESDDGFWNISNFVIFLFTLLFIGALNFFIHPLYENLVSNWSLALCFFIMYFGCLTFFLNLSSRFRRLRFSFFVYSILYFISILGYFSSCKLWVSNERQVASKVFGIYKSMHMTPKIEEMKFAKDCLELNIFNTHEMDLTKKIEE